MTRAQTLLKLKTLEIAIQLLKWFNGELYLAAIGTTNQRLGTREYLQMGTDGSFGQDKVFFFSRSR